MTCRPTTAGGREVRRRGECITPCAWRCSAAPGRRLGSFGAGWYDRDVASVFQAAARALRPGGLIVVRAPNNNAVVDRTLARLGRWARRFMLIAPPRHLYDYDRSTLAALLRKVGYRVVRMANACPRGTGSTIRRSAGTSPLASICNGRVHPGADTYFPFRVES